MPFLGEYPSERQHKRRRFDSPGAMSAADVSDAVAFASSRSPDKAKDMSDEEYRRLADSEARMLVAAASMSSSPVPTPLPPPSSSSYSAAPRSSSGSHHRVVQASTLDSLFGGLPSLPFNTGSSFSSPGVFSGTSGGIMPTSSAGRLQSGMDFVGSMTRGSNMNKTDETWPVTVHHALTTDWGDIPSGLKQSGPSLADFAPIYRDWQVAVSNICFGSKTGSVYTRSAGDTSAYTGRWDDGTIRCLSWFSLNFELFYLRHTITTLSDFMQRYQYLGYLQTVEAGDTTLGRGAGYAAGSATGAFHMMGRSRMPNIWALQDDGAGLKTYASLWLVLRTHVCVQSKDKQECSLRLEPWADVLNLTTANRLPTGTLHAWHIGHLDYTEGSACPPMQRVEQAFYPKVDTGTSTRDALHTILNMLPKCYVNVGIGGSMFASA